MQQAPTTTLIDMMSTRIQLYIYTSTSGMTSSSSNALQTLAHKTSYHDSQPCIHDSTYIIATVQMAGVEM